MMNEAFWNRGNDNSKSKSQSAEKAVPAYTTPAGQDAHHPAVETGSGGRMKALIV